MFLDECLNNLDADLNSDILRSLREWCTEKLIVVISHEAIEGEFEEIIDIDDC